VVTAVLLLLGAIPQSQAATITLIDRNSTVQIDPDSSSGNFNWLVEGVDHMARQWFWYRIGTTGPESPINALSAATVNVGNFDADAGNELANISYSAGGLTITVGYTLTGGLPGSFTSLIAEEITVDNQTGAAIDFHFFQYSDFDLGGTAGGDTAQVVNANSVEQFDLPAGIISSETVVTPAPSHVEVNTFPNTLNSLNDGNPTTLNDSTGPLGPADVTWAFQWDVTIENNSSFLISKNKRIAPVPEPTSLVLCGLGIVTACGFGIRRKLKQRKAAAV
jgi:hypothetical protein